MKYFAGYVAVVACCSFLFADEVTIPLDQVSFLTSSRLSPFVPSNEEQSKVIKQNFVDALTKALDQNQTLNWLGDQQWKPFTQVKPPPKGQPVILRFRVSADRFTQGTLKVKGLANPSLYVNGQNISGSGPFKLILPNADYRLMLIADEVASWEELALSWDSEDATSVPEFRTDSGLLRLTPEVLYDSETISQISLAPDASLLFWVKRSYGLRTKDTAVSVAELVRPETMEVVYRWQSMTPQSVAWRQDSSVLAYTYDDSIFLLELANLKQRTLATQVKEVADLNWLNSNTLIFSWTQPAKKSEGFTKLYRSLEDRWSNWRDRAQIFQMDIESGLIQQLTKNELSSIWLDTDPEKRRLLFFRNPINYEQPAHTLTQLFELNLDSFEEKLIGEYRTFDSAAYHPQGILMTAGPSFHQGLGRAIEEQQPVNDYDTQVYLIRPEGEVIPLARDFKPSINHVEVLKNGDLVLSATDQDRVQLFTYTLKSGQFHPIDSDIELVESFTVSNQSAAQIVFKGTSATHPQKVRMAHTGSRETKLLLDTTTESYANRAEVTMKDWDYQTEKGHFVDGRYYLPPDFDPQKSYPAIIYYYGGTSPVTRAFSGRWPFVLYASHGYVVYVLQPSGATGYGQEFSGLHVNAWGLETAEDIMESTQAFVKAHPFVDGQRLGNMGASYGGFMTMYLATQTEQFRASISHAGISNLTSYWGHGWWGYSYSGVATQGRFPWNSADFYTSQSPVFHADKVKTPMLLLHGDSDTNVPVGESHQMYTALKLLGKEVDLVEFQGDDHHINARTHRLRWWDTILSYFDRELKNQPQWWQYLYPEK